VLSSGHVFVELFAEEDACPAETGLDRRDREAKDLRCFFGGSSFDVPQDKDNAIVDGEFEDGDVKSRAKLSLFSETVGRLLPGDVRSNLIATARIAADLLAQNRSLPCVRSAAF
jgi:hypothetical protein